MSTESTFHWTPLTADLAYNERVCREAVAGGVSAVQFSHRLGHNVDDLIGRAEKLDHARKLFELYDGAGLDVWCWTHEVKDPDEKYVRDGKLLADEDGLYGAIATKYDRFLTETLPGVKGLVLTLAETSCQVCRDQEVISDQDAATRARRVVNAVAAACRRHGARLAVRDSLYRKSEIDALREMFQQLPPDVIVMSKCVPQDWHAFYPANPMIGNVGEREQWVEHDFGYEHEGQHLYPYADIERVYERVRYERRKGVRTWCLRLDRYNADNGYSALLNPWGRLALDTVKQTAEDPDLDLETVWDTWEKDHFMGARTVLNIATQTVRHMLFSLGTMTHNHSRLPTYAYARSHITRIDPQDRPREPRKASDKALALAIDNLRGGWMNCDRVAGWTDDPADRALEEAMESMTEDCLEECVRESEQIQALAVQARECIEAIDHGGPDAESWEKAVEQLVVWAYCFGAWKRAYFHIRRCQEHPSKRLAERCEELITEFEDICVEAAPALDGVFLGAGPVCRDGSFATDVVDSLREALACADPVQEE